MTIVKKERPQYGGPLGAHVELTATRLDKMDETRLALRTKHRLVRTVNVIIKTMLPKSHVTIKRLRWQR